MDIERIDKIYIRERETAHSIGWRVEYRSYFRWWGTWESAMKHALYMAWLK